MAVAYVRGSGMTAADNSDKTSSVSALKEETEYLFPDGDMLTVVPANLSDDERSGLTQRIKSWEKENLINRKNRNELNGSIRDTRSRFGDPKEWDHLQISLDRPESESYGPADLARMRDIIRDIAAKDISGRFQKMVMTRIHTDTGNSHIDVFIHRHPYDAENNQTLASEELTGKSFLPNLMQKISNALAAADLPIIRDTKKQDGQSLYEESATTDRAKNIANSYLTEEGGIPNQRTGAPGVYAEDDERPSRVRLEPDANIIQKALLDAEREMKAAAQKLVNAQNAAAAMTERAELRARLEEAEATVAAQEAAIEAARVQHAAELAERQASIAALNTDIEKAGERETGLRSELEVVSTKVEEQTAQIAGLTDDYEGAQAEITAQAATIKGLQGELFDVKGQVTAQAEQLAERDKTIAEQEDSIETLVSQLEQANEAVSQQGIEIADRDATINQLRTEVSISRAALDTAKETISKQGGEIEGLRSTVHQRDMDVAKATGTVEALTKQVNTLTNERDAFRTTAEEQTQALKVVTNEHENLKLHSADLMKKYGDLRGLHNTILSGLAPYVPENTRTDLREAVRSFVGQYIAMSNNDEKAQARVKELEAMVSKVQAENDQIRTIVQQLKEGGTGEGGDPPPSI